MRFKKIVLILFIWSNYIILINKCSFSHEVLTLLQERMRSNPEGHILKAMCLLKAIEPIAFIYSLKFIVDTDLISSIDHKDLFF